MDVQKFTQKSLEAIQKSSQIAKENNNSEVEQEHLLLALIDDKEGLIKQLFTKMNVNNELQNELIIKIKNKPKISGTNKVYFSMEAEETLNVAEKQAQNMKDEYVSVEHIMLGILEKPNSNLKQLFKQFGIDKNKFLKLLLGGMRE